MDRDGLIIAIDGPAGAGKSTIARGLARRLGYLFINTGAMYRTIAWKAREAGIQLDDREAIGRLAKESEIVHREISDGASIVSAIPAVRRALVTRQQEMGARGGVVMEGRDIGTMVFPGADLKIYLDATPAARAARRHAEDLARGPASSSLEQLQCEIEARDTRDKTRADSPLVQAADAIYLDSSALSIDEVIGMILALADQKR